MRSNPGKAKRPQIFILRAIMMIEVTRHPLNFFFVSALKKRFFLELCKIGRKTVPCQCRPASVTPARSKGAAGWAGSNAAVPAKHSAAIFLP
jgi:hypothetical protein